MKNHVKNVGVSIISRYIECKQIVLNPHGHRFYAQLQCSILTWLSWSALREILIRKRLTRFLIVRIFCYESRALSVKSISMRICTIKINVKTIRCVIFSFHLHFFFLFALNDESVMRVWLHCGHFLCVFNEMSLRQVIWRQKKTNQR